MIRQKSQPHKHPQSTHPSCALNPLACPAPAFQPAPFRPERAARSATAPRQRRRPCSPPRPQRRVETATTDTRAATDTDTDEDAARQGRKRGTVGAHAEVEHGTTPTRRGAGPVRPEKEKPTGPTTTTALTTTIPPSRHTASKTASTQGQQGGTVIPAQQQARTR